MTDWNTLLQKLAAKGTTIERGLSARELAGIETTFAWEFPPDLREFLSAGLPQGPGFPDWRRRTDAMLEQLEWPVEGLLFDVVHNVLWFDEWGPRPPDPMQASELAERELRAVPALIPVYGHRYLPSQPHQAGNPVLSVHQGDIIIYGSELRTWLAIEFEIDAGPPTELQTTELPFWSELIS